MTVGSGVPTGARDGVRMSWPAAITLAGGAVMLATAAVFAVVVATGRPSPESLAAGTAFLQPVDYESPKPFTASVATVGTDALRVAVPAGGTRGRVTGDTAGLYASTGGRPPCDAAALVEALTADAALGSAWAAAAEVDPATIPQVVGALTPVVLATDTAVTNHLYDTDGAEAYQAVLQAGTAVMVDDLGVPRVQCSCGNPLLPPDPDADRFVGASWDGFDDGRIVQVAPSPEPIDEIETIDAGSGEPVRTPVGGGAVLDGLLVADGAGVHVLAEDGTRTTVFDRPVAEVFDDGAGGLLFNLARSTPDPGDVRSLTWSPPASIDEATIWHLPAGESEPVPLLSSDDPAGRWHVVLGTGTLGGARVMAYTTLVPELVYETESTPTGPVLLRDLSTGADRVLEDEGFGWELGTGPISFNDQFVAYDQGYASGFYVVRNPELGRVPNACAPTEEAIADDTSWCPYADAIDAPGRVVDVTAYDPRTGDDLSAPHVILFDRESFAEVARWPLPDLTADDLGGAVVDVSGTKLLLSFGSTDGAPSGRALLVDLESGAVTPAGADGLVRFLRAPLRRPAGGTTVPPPPPPPTTAAAPALDPMNMLLPGAVCGTEGDPDVPITDGSGSVGDPMDYDSGFTSADLTGARSVTADLDGDGVTEVVVAPVCNWGGSGHATPVAVLHALPDGRAQLVAPVMDYGRGARDVSSLRLDGDVLVIDGNEWTAGDAMCCPSLSFVERHRFVDGDWQPA